MNIGEALRQVRVRKNIKQQDVAAKAKVSQTYLSLIESGAKKNPSQKLIEKLCKIYGMPQAIVVWMATEEKDIEPKKRHLYKTVSPTISALIEEFFKVK